MSVDLGLYPNLLNVSFSKKIAAVAIVSPLPSCIKGLIQPSFQSCLGYV